LIFDGKIVKVHIADGVEPLHLRSITSKLLKIVVGERSPAIRITRIGFGTLVDGERDEVTGNLEFNAIVLVVAFHSIFEMKQLTKTTVDRDEVAPHMQWLLKQLCNAI